MKFFRGTLLGVGLGALILAAILIVIGLATGLKPEMPRMLWRGLSSPVSLADAATRAETRAHTWAADAYLVRVEASWRPDATWVKADQPPVSWSLGYFSPSQQGLALVSVRGPEVLWVAPISMAEAPPALAPFPPAFGLDVAWLSFRAAGGEDFLQKYADSMVHFQLLRKEDTLVWEVLGVNGNAHHEVSVDAVSGTVIVPTVQP